MPTLSRITFFGFYFCFFQSQSQAGAARQQKLQVQKQFGAHFPVPPPPQQQQLQRQVPQISDQKPINYSLKITVYFGSGKQSSPQRTTKIFPILSRHTPSSTRSNKHRTLSGNAPKNGHETNFLFFVCFFQDSLIWETF